LRDLLEVVLQRLRSRKCSAIKCEPWAYLEASKRNVNPGHDVWVADERDTKQYIKNLAVWTDVELQIHKDDFFYSSWEQNNWKGTLV
jgi:hypothetical protein